MRANVRTVVTAVVAGMIVVSGAQAQTVTSNLNVTTPISVGAWTFQMGGCGTSVSGTGSAGSCATDQVTATATASMLTLVFTGANGTPLLTGGVSSTADLSLTNLIVTAPSGLQIWQVGANVSGSTSTGTTRAQNNVSLSSGNIVSGSSSYTAAMANLNTAPLLQLAPPPVFAPNNKVSSVPDLTLGTSTNTATMASATLVYNAPEPVSMTLLGTGIAALGFVRRKARRRV